MSLVDTVNADTFQMNILGKQLKKFCKDKDLTVSQLSRATKIPLATLTHIVNGRSPRKLEHIKAMCEYFSVTSDELLFGKKPMVNNELSPAELVNFGTYDVYLKKK